MNIWVITIVIMVASLIIQQTLNSKFNKYSKVPTANGMTGAEVAEKMLHDNGIYDVKVTATRGMLTDHYNPVTKTVNLSEGVYASRSVAAAAVAAHECGHAVQHAMGYAWNRPVCNHHPLQLHHPSGGSQCQHKSYLMAHQHRGNRLRDTSNGY